MANMMLADYIKRFQSTICPSIISPKIFIIDAEINIISTIRILFYNDKWGKIIDEK